jgi:hypothetical protein
MFRATLVLLSSASTLLIGSLTAYGTAQTSKPYFADTDHTHFLVPTVQFKIKFGISSRTGLMISRSQSSSRSENRSATILRAGRVA